MHALRSIRAAVLAFAPLCAGQSLQLVPDISLAAAEYHDALDAWRRSDQDLARDLFTRPPEEMRGRIRKTAALRDDAMVKKGAYLDLIARRLRDTRRHLQDADAGAIPAEALKKHLAAQQSHILGEQENIEASLREVPEGDQYLLVRRALEDERATLVSLQNHIAMRMRSLETIDQAQQGMRNGTTPDVMVRKLDEILKVWDREKEAVTRQRAMWADIYDAMERSLARNDPTDKAAPRATPPSVPPKSQKDGHGQPPDGSPGGGPTANSSGLTGTWIYRSQPGAWTGYGEPEAVSLVLQEQGAELAGTYTARLPLRDGNANVRLSLTCLRRSASSARLHWNSQAPPGEGEMEIKLASDGRLFVERLRAADSYFPRGMEVLQRR
jgi:hypothetical protein